MPKATPVIFSLLFLCFLVGCSKPKNFVNYRIGDLETSALSKTSYEPLTIQPGDLLGINLISTETESVAIFNDFQPGGYEVSEEGKISFPLVGDVTVEGKTIAEVKQVLFEATSKYFVDAPVLNVSLLNFKVTINGEVASPSILSVPNGRINIIEAVTRAGDLTPYAQRDSVMIIREENDVRSIGYIDFYKMDIFNSPYFYLRQNDIIYVKPNKDYVATVNTRPEKLRSFVSIGLSVVLLALNISRL